MGKKLPELCVERVLLTGRCAGGEHFFIRRAGEVGGRCAKGGGDDLELVALGSDLPAFQSWQTVGVRPMRRAMDALVTPVSRISASNLL